MTNGRARQAVLILLCLVPWTGIGAQQPPAPPDEFGRAIQPLLAKYCISCHGASPKPKADLDLTKTTSETGVRQNPKLWRLAVRMLNAHEMPPVEGKIALPQNDRDSLVKAIEAALRRVDPNAPVNPGRVTVRRLNRTEYGNTIRDLTGVDFDPAEDFPSDDIGLGFDNIGDVLTLPPVLMERYLAAAESVLERCFPTTPLKPSEENTAARYLEPAGRNVPQSRFRPVTAAKGDAVATGPLHKEYRVRPDGEYVFRFRAYGKPKGVKVAVLAVGRDVPGPATDAEAAKLAGASLQGLRPFKILQVVELKGTDERTVERVEVKFGPLPGVRRIALAIVNGAAGAPPPEIFVQDFQLSGPLDPRPPFQKQVFAAVASKPKAQQTREILKDFASRAYRRPVTDAELARLVKVVEDVEKTGAKPEVGLQLAFQAVLVSPKFLFRVELDHRPEQPEAHPITDPQLAARLSYFLWSTMPDDELRALAAKNALAPNLEAQARRMLKSPRAVQALVDNFAMQWLQLRRISFVAPDGQLFPAFNQRLRESMLRETELLLETVVQEDRSLLDLLAADYTFLNERLARHYGIADTAGNRPGQKNPKPGGQPIRGEGFVRTALQDGERGGLLTQASVLTVTSNPTRTSPVKRGRWVLEQILGEPPPPPPPDVPELNETAAAVQSGTLKQRLEQHRADPRCANCHARMDAIGFALENYNAVGAWRTKDGAFDIDASAAFPDGTKFTGPGELRKALLARKELFVRCVIEKMLTYALGRAVEPFDEPAIQRIQAALAKDNYRFSTLAVEIVKSDPFRLRRGMNSKE
jgi:hypothetical protein